MQPFDKDYYQILGVLRTASLSDVTAAYRALARVCHPDAVGGDTHSLTKIKLINEAYEVLSDQDKRRDYDRQYADSSANQADKFASQTDTPFWTGNRWPPGDQNSLDLVLDLPIAPEEAFHGGPCSFHLKYSTRCQSCSGKTSIGSSKCEGCDGSGRQQQTRPITALIPRGARTGTRLRVNQFDLPSEVNSLTIRCRIAPCW